ncbi:MAG: glycosyltransferase N-terminal domain-containing protein [Chlorobiota bacterium]
MPAALWLYEAALRQATSLARLSPQLRLKAKAREEWHRHLRELQDWSYAAPHPRLWVHSASAGEFEHVRPVLQLLQARLPQLSVILTFFSPSGYEAHRATPFADKVFLLPPDLPDSRHSFLAALQPTAAVFVRYELWLGYLAALRQRQVPTFLVAATFPRSSLWRLPVAQRLLRQALSSFQRIWALNDREAAAFRRLVPEVPVTVVPDPRYDRIWQVAHQEPRVWLPEAFRHPGSFCLIAGSTWEEDHRLLAGMLRYLPNDLRQRLVLIIVPHEPDPARVTALLRLFRGAHRWTEVTDASPGVVEQGPQVLIVDRFGLLLHLYCFADVAYVGGGFGHGVHNLAEPAAYGIPLVCGPRVQKSPDAHALLRTGALTIVRTERQFADWLYAVFSNPEERQRLGTTAQRLLQQRGGAESIATSLAAVLSGLSEA